MENSCADLCKWWRGGHVLETYIIVSVHIQCVIVFESNREHPFRYQPCSAKGAGDINYGCAENLSVSHTHGVLEKKNILTCREATLWLWLHNIFNSLLLHACVGVDEYKLKDMCSHLAVSLHSMAKHSLARNIIGFLPILHSNFYRSCFSSTVPVFTAWV